MSDNLRRAVEEKRREREAEQQAAKDLLARLDGNGTGAVDIIQAANLALVRAEYTDAPQPSADDLVAAYGHLAAARDEVDWVEQRLIEALLDSGMSWEQMGAAVGRGSRQAMQQRYKRVGGSRSWPTRTPAQDSESAS